VNGFQEVSGSIPFSSTKQNQGLTRINLVSPFLLFIISPHSLPIITENSASPKQRREQEAGIEI